MTNWTPERIRGIADRMASRLGREVRVSPVTLPLVITALRHYADDLTAATAPWNRRVSDPGVDRPWRGTALDHALTAESKVVRLSVVVPPVADVPARTLASVSLAAELLFVEEAALVSPPPPW